MQDPAKGLCVCKILSKVAVESLDARSLFASTRSHTEVSLCEVSDSVKHLSVRSCIKFVSCFSVINN